jgi:plasmid stabilization system protein ParE
MNVEYSKRAVSDLRQIAAYHARSDASAVGEQIAAAIRELVARIGQAPQRGRPVVQRPGVRVMLLVRYDSPDHSHPAHVAPAVAARLKWRGIASSLRSSQ